jgi:hypothetical protein
MKKSTRIILIVLSSALLVYSGFLIKKSLEKGYPSQELEKEVLLGNFVIMKGLPNTKKNRDAYRFMTVEQLRGYFVY